MKKSFIKFFLWYIRLAAKIQLLKIRPKIIALTGSVGKSSLRQAIFTVLKDTFKCKQSIKANSETGLPLDILNLHPQTYSLLDWLRLAFLVPLRLLTDWHKYDYYIAELGIDDPFPPKNMEYLLSFIKPDVGIFLNVALVHTLQFEKIIPKGKKFFPSRSKQKFLKQAIASEKGKIITLLDKSKKAIVNFDDCLVFNEGQKAKAKVYYFGKRVKGKEKNELKIISNKVSLKGTEFVYQYKNEKFFLKFKYLLPGYYAYTFAAAALTGLALDIGLEQIKTSLAKNFVLPPGRMSCFAGIKKTVIIDSSYNASTTSTLGALKLLAQFKNKKGKSTEKRDIIFVFGDMRELGSQAKKEHQQVAKKLLTIVDRLVLIGPLTKKYVFPLIIGKIPVEWFANSWQAADFLKNNLKGKEIILVKSSQNTIFTEIVVEGLLFNKKDKAKLCRRGRFWEKQRQLIKK